MTLTDVPKRAGCTRRAWPRRPGNDVRWFVPKIRRALRMKLQTDDRA